MSRHRGPPVTASGTSFAAAGVTDRVPEDEFGMRTELAGSGLPAGYGISCAAVRGANTAVRDAIRASASKDPENATTGSAATTSIATAGSSSTGCASRAATNSGSNSGVSGGAANRIRKDALPATALGIRGSGTLCAAAGREDEVNSAASKYGIGVRGAVAHSPATMPVSHAGSEKTFAGKTSAGYVAKSRSLPAGVVFPIR